MIQDLKYGIRQLRLNPGFTAVAALTLALGIGVNTSIFSLVNALMLRPVAVPRSGELMTVYRGDGRPCSYPEFIDFRRRADAFSGLAADATTESALDIDARSEVILAEAVSWNYAAVLGLKPALGRWFAAEDEANAEEFPAVIGYRTWQSRLGGDPGAIGKQVRLESQRYTVIGVAPKDFEGMALPVLTGIWIPLSRYAQHNDFAARLMTNREGNRVLMFGRVNSGVSISRADAQLNAIDPARAGRTPLRVEHARGTSDPGYRRSVGQLLVLLSAVVGLVLLIGCANVANLLQARGVSRRREVSTRIALGASRARICRQMLIESLLLSLIGSTAGLGAAWGTNRILERSIASAPLPIAVGARLSLDWRVLGFVLAASVATTLLFGLLPALQASRPDLVATLKGGEPLSRNRRFTLRNLSVVAQVMFSLVLLIAAGLFVRALGNASRIEPGFDAGRLLSARLFAPESQGGIYRQVVDRARRLPGVRDASLSYASPMIGMSECVAPGRVGVEESITAGANVIGTHYFSTFGIPLIGGRDFGSADNSTGSPVAIVNETLARRFWPGQNPVGKRIRTGTGCAKGEGVVAEIVGVVKDARYASLDVTMRPFVFFPLEQHFAGYLALVIRADRNPAELITSVREELRGTSGTLRVYSIETLSAQTDASLWQTRWEASLLSAFGVLALMIAAVGLYGSVAFAARQRTREFGIRIALGAQKRDVLRLVTGDALTLALAGIGPGLAISLASTRLLRGFLYGLSPADTVTYAGAALLWTAISLVASCVPAYRAAGVYPSLALREE